MGSTEIPQRTHVPARVYNNGYVTAVAAGHWPKPTVLFWCGNLYGTVAGIIPVPLPGNFV
jgi:hypothetical protein